MIKDFKILLFIVALFLIPMISPIIVTHTTGNQIIAATPAPTITRTPTRLPSPCKTGLPLYAEAENSSNNSGIVKNGTYISSCDDGDWVMYNLNIGCGHFPPRYFSTNVAVPNENAGKQIEFRANSPTGGLLGTMTLNGTGGYAPNFTIQTYRITGTFPLSSYAATLQVYLVFKGGANIADFDWFRFDVSSVTPPPPTPTPVIVRTPTPPVGGTPTPTPTWKPTPTFGPTITPVADTFYVYQVVTGEATNITETTATLSASAIRQLAHPNGYPIFTQNITMALVYWEESNPTNKITSGTVTTLGSASYPLTANITGLKPATTYMFQAIIQSGSSTYPNGAVKSFQTLGDPVITPTVPPVTPTPPPGTGNIKVQFYNQSTAATSNQIYLNIKLVNIGTSAIALANVNIRYYYTKDGTQGQTFYCDYSPVGSANITGSFVTMPTAKVGADTYVEIGFTTGAGSLAAGGNTTIQARFAKSDWSNYTQTNDYSFNSTATTFVDWNKVTGYISGSLQWGVEP